MTVPYTPITIRSKEAEMNFIKEFQAWAEAKDPKESYSISSPSQCALGQFVRSIHPYAVTRDTGYYTGKYVKTEFGGYTQMDSEFHKYPLEAYECAVGSFEEEIILGEFNTFGELTKRLKEVNHDQ